MSYAIIARKVDGELLQGFSVDRTKHGAIAIECIELPLLSSHEIANEALIAS